MVNIAKQDSGSVIFKSAHSGTMGFGNEGCILFRILLPVTVATVRFDGHCLHFCLFFGGGGVFYISYAGYSVLESCCLDCFTFKIGFIIF